MESSHALHDTESSGTRGIDGHAAEGHFWLVAHLPAVGNALLALAAIGGVAGAFARSALSVLLGVACGVAGWLIHLIDQQKVLRADESSPPSLPVPKTGVVTFAGLGSTVCALFCIAFDALASLGRALVKLLASVVAGTSAALLTVGIFALQEPETWDYVLLRRAGPPLGPVALGAGIGLLVAEVLLVALFCPWRTGGTRRSGATGQADSTVR